MRVRYEMYRNGTGTGTTAECDMDKKKARKLFDQLKINAKCGWVELVAEDDEEGGYMEIIDSHSQIRLAQIISSMV